MQSFKIVKKEESPTIPLNKVDLNPGFILVTSNEENVGIICYDCEKDRYFLMCSFCDYFSSGIDCDGCYCADILEDLMEEINTDFNDPIEFNFFKITK